MPAASAAKPLHGSAYSAVSRLDDAIQEMNLALAKIQS